MDIKTRFRYMCVENDFFTCGSNEQYERVMDFVESLYESDYLSNLVLVGVIYMVYICSDTDEFTVTDIGVAVKKMFRDAGKSVM